MSNSAHTFLKFNGESHFSQISPLTPTINKSKSFQNTFSPRIPSSPHVTKSPRQKNQSFDIQSKNLIFNSTERVKNILGILDRNEICGKAYCKCPNCCIFEKDIENKGYYEKKFTRREYPSFFPNDRQFFIFLMQEFENAIKDVNERHPEYYHPKTNQNEQIKGSIAELDLWFTLFDECIFQESTRSRANAFILKNISEVFKLHFTMLIKHVENGIKKAEQIEEYYKKKLDEESLIPSLKSEIESLKREIERRKREYKTLKNENSRYHVENFQLKNEISTSKNDISKLLKASEVLEGQLSQSQRRIYDLTLKHDIIPMDSTMGAVPDDILKIWDQSSQFLRVILNDTLDSYDLNEIIPKAMPSPDNDYLISLPKLENYPREENCIFHFTQLYKSIKYCAGECDPSSFFKTLEMKIRNLFKKFSSFYYDRISWARKTQIEHISHLNEYNKDLRKNIPDLSIVIKTILENAKMFKYPKNLPDIIPMIIEVFQQVPKLMKQKTKPRSAAEIVTKTFTGSELILFLMIVAKHAKTDILTDIFRMSIMNEIPFYVFIFFAKMHLELEGSSTKKRLTFMSSTFGPVGFNSIPADIRRSFEISYSPAVVTFEIFMISMYQYSIKKLSNKLSDQINLKDIENSAEVYFKLNELEALDLFQYMTAISAKVKPSAIEFAVCAFDRKVQFDDLIVDFDPSKSEIIEYMNNFGKGSIKGSSKKKKLKSNHLNMINCEESKINSMIIGNIIAMDENVENLFFDDGKDVKIQERQKMTETGINGDGLMDILFDQTNNENMSDHEKFGNRENTDNNHRINSDNNQNCVINEDIDKNQNDMNAKINENMDIN